MRNLAVRMAPSVVYSPSSVIARAYALFGTLVWGLGWSLLVSLFAVPALSPIAAADAVAQIEEITKVVLRSNRDGAGTTWFHPRCCLVPDGLRGKVLMNMQPIGGSDYFGSVHWSSLDLGPTLSQESIMQWTDPEPIAALGRDPVEGDPGLMAGVCDVVPQYHPRTGTALAMGHVVFYRGPRFASADQLARYPVYVVRRKDGTWSGRNILKWDDPRGRFIYSNNCGQRIVMPNGDIMMSFTFGPEARKRMVAGVRCTFDGETLRVAQVGTPLVKNVKRGLLEPSVTRYGDLFYMTIRAEDNHGYVAVSSDGVDYRDMIPWRWDDGSALRMSTTQQHWLEHSNGLFLVYTREDASNRNVIRWRAPLWIAQVDPERRCLLRRTERVLLPIVGDGMGDPKGVALMGNFAVVHVSAYESWVTVGEWIPNRNATGDLLLARIHWKVPNANWDRDLR